VAPSRGHPAQDHQLETPSRTSVTRWRISLQGTPSRDTPSRVLLPTDPIKRTPSRGPAPDPLHGTPSRLPHPWDPRERTPRENPPGAPTRALYKGPRSTGHPQWPSSMGPPKGHPPLRPQEYTQRPLRGDPIQGTPSTGRRPPEGKLAWQTLESTIRGLPPGTASWGLRSGTLFHGPCSKGHFPWAPSR
jgi:hypothetical protein